MLFNKINTSGLQYSISSGEYKVDDYITIEKIDRYRINIYIDGIKAINLLLVRDCYTYQTSWIKTYYYKIPRKVIKKINQWLKDIEADKVNEKKKIEQHFKDLYK